MCNLFYLGGGLGGCPGGVWGPGEGVSEGIWEGSRGVCLRGQEGIEGPRGGLSEGSLGAGVRGVSVCGISTYKQVKFLDKILQHSCGNSFYFLM